MRGFGSASPETLLPNLFSLLENSRDVLLSLVPSLMAGSLFFLGLLVFLLLLFLLLVCRPWRFFVRSSRPIETDEVTRPLISENLDGFLGQNNGLARSAGEQRQVIQIDENGSSIRNHGFVSRKRAYSVQPAIIQEESTLIDYENDVHDVGSTLKRNAVSSWCPPDSKHVKQHGGYFAVPSNDAKLPQISTLSLEVISGPSSGLSMSITSATSLATLTIGRVPPSSLILKDSEVSGRHAVVNFNYETRKWEIIDLGSLNGTFVNSTAIHHPDVGSRKHGAANTLSSGDVITLGTSSKVLVHILQDKLENSLDGIVGENSLNEILPNHNLRSTGIGMASDPMARRRGGKALPMEDVGVTLYPLPGVGKFGLVGVFDGHGGSGAAKTASKAFPENVVKVLSQSGAKEKVLSSSDASGILQEAFAFTEAQMKHHEYEGCTATVLLIWSGLNEDLFAQCANLGDSECVMYVDGKQIVMTEVHKVNSVGERARIAQTGNPLKDGESRIGGLNLCRMLGDGFLKAQDQRFISEPYVSKPVHVTKGSTAFALVASDGLWDVLRPNQAVQFVLENKAKVKGQEDDAEIIAKSVVKEAEERRTKDNTTVVYVDFDTLRTYSSSIL
ncbi:Protein phosphatase 2C family protein [Rhynchospora pubera]|uniref:protein-serine/threonine phosphatase n=1 Tax=Rhynchospora pubera TaxID=906938 RepID=A0AAV8FX40_9POAL|nr:Protein phosphatase 2C family protein [Rhynchospora pubera]